MSWDSYIDVIIGKAPGVITKAAIVGHNGAIWTAAGVKPETLALTPQDALAIGTGMASKKNWAAEGVTIGGVKYMFLRDMDGDGRIITFKKTGTGNLVFISTKTAVIVGFVPEAQNHSAGSANVAVEGVAKYLEEAGY